MPTPAELTTPDLLVEASRRLSTAEFAVELCIRAARLRQLARDVQPDRNMYAGQTPAYLMDLVNAPSPKGT